MSITIHFEGTLKDETAYEAVVSEASNLATEMSWPARPISEKKVTLLRVKGEKDWDYVGPVKGIEIRPHENSDPLRLVFDRQLYVQEYIKTQFAPVEIHVAVSDFLKRLEPYFESFNVTDEGEYYDTNNLKKLEDHIQWCYKALDQYLDQEDKYYGPVRSADGRIIDVLEKD
ncbi:MAG: hypothetical protein OES46_01825 [Gammaproteobacteria bacterium]|jgi:hypothetical protein|nr:hypothetical protein [Gammaproteobacteria bacterium]